jgi:hypothetical protein
VRPTPADPTVATEEWFLHHGLSYFVPEERHAARAALRARRIVPLLLVVVVLATGAGGLLAWVAHQVTVAPALLISVGLGAATWYALTVLRARPIVTWALARTFGSLRTLLPMTTRALPLLLMFITFLFINTEVWQVATHLSVGALWLVALLFLLLGVAFLLVRLPEEVDRTDDDVDDRMLLDATRGTPLEESCRELVQDPARHPAAYAEVTGYERWNLVVVLMIVQSVQVLLLTLSVFAFLMVFGSLTMTEWVMQTWLMHGAHHLPGMPGASTELLQVSVFLASFSGLYLTVSTVTDETYREQFFGDVMRELERAVGVRAVYLALRDAEQRAGGDEARTAR